MLHVGGECKSNCVSVSARNWMRTPQQMGIRSKDDLAEFITDFDPHRKIGNIRVGIDDQRYYGFFARTHDVGARSLPPHRRVEELDCAIAERIGYRAAVVCSR